MTESIQVKVTKQGNELKLSWTGEGWSRVYCVAGEVVKQASQNVRAVLQQIASVYLHPSGSYAPYFSRLAAESEGLRVSLFPQGDEKATGLLHYLISPSQGVRKLRVYSDGAYQIPWNFLYNGDASEAHGVTGTLADFDQFWSSIFHIAIRFASTDIPPSSPVERQKIKTLFALHETRYQDAADLLKNSGLEGKMQNVFSHEVGAARDWIDCREKWKTIVNEDSILYIFAHSNEQSLYLKDKNFSEADRHRFVLDSAGFARIFGKSVSTRSTTLCFINGCRTADGELGSGFLNLTSSHGFLGFIGSEAEISNEWATRYAVLFLDLLLSEGKSVEEAYQALRSTVFPMSLWYSCFAHPQFRLVEAPSEAIA